VRYTIIEGDASLGLGRYLSVGAPFDACLCDPPYGYAAFKSKTKKTADWEKEAMPPTSLWEDVFDHLRPGSLMMAATGPRLYHRMACHIEAAGFYILDPFAWLYTGANATGVREGIRLRPAREDYVVAWKPRPRVGKRFNPSAGVRGLPCNTGMDAALMAACMMEQPFLDTFFFCGKAPPSERVPGDDHPTHKPLKLCEHLAGLMRPSQKMKRLLVPFSGVGSEMIGAIRAGWPEVVGLEREKKYVAVAHRRIAKFTEGAVCQ